MQDLRDLLQSIKSGTRIFAPSGAAELDISNVPPVRIVPMLADEGVYIASESSFCRILRAKGQNAHRGRARAPRPVRSPTTHIASAPREVWWDMTFLPTQVIGRWYYLYLILDRYSRKIIGWEAARQGAAARRRYVPTFSNAATGLSPQGPHASTGVEASARY